MIDNKKLCKIAYFSVIGKIIITNNESEGNRYMQSFDYTVGCVGGLHARPAGAIVNAAKHFSSDILIRKLSPDGAREADAKRLISLMSLGAKRGDTIKFIINGPDESDAAEKMKSVCRESVG